MLDDFCESTGYCRRHASRVLHLAGQRSLLGDCILVADPTKHIHLVPSSPIPLHRLLQTPEITDQAKSRLLRQLRDIDPLSLQQDIDVLQARLLGKTSQDLSLGAVTRQTISL